MHLVILVSGDSKEEILETIQSEDFLKEIKTESNLIGDFGENNNVKVDFQWGNEFYKSMYDWCKEIVDEWNLDCAEMKNHL